MNINKDQLISINIFLFLFCVVNVANAAILYLSPETGQYQPGETFLVDIKIDTEGKCINTVNADLQFSNDVLTAVDFSRGESILSVWINPPVINQEQGLISFAGGVPGGYCGRIPGDPAFSNSLGKIIFKVPGMAVKKSGAEVEKTLAKIEFLNSSQAFLNDGLGTAAELKTKGAILTVLPAKSGTPKDEWQKALAEDKIPPELFTIEIHQTPEIFEGKYFIIFSTTDKQTGIDHYEISETRDSQQEVWKRAESPYMLNDQKLKSTIKVRAIDKARNERIVVSPPRYLLEWYGAWWIWVIVGMGAVIAYFTGRILWKKYAKIHK